MNIRQKLLGAILGIALLTTVASAFAHDLKVDNFQVTGTVSAVDADSITVMKGKERFQIAKDKDTKMTPAEPKVGDKVTVQYKMYAASVETKSGEKAAAKPAKKK
jgi:hypothetical protein